MIFGCVSFSSSIAFCAVRDCGKPTEVGGYYLFVKQKKLPWHMLSFWEKIKIPQDNILSLIK